MNEKNLGDFFTKFDEYVLAIAKSFHRASMSDLHNSEITIPQLAMIQTVGRLGSPRVSDVSEDMGVTLGNITLMTDKLQKEGYVIRSDDPGDRRIVKVSLTPKAKMLLKKSEESKVRHLKTLFKGLDGEDMCSALKLMEKVVSSIKENKEREKNNES